MRGVCPVAVLLERRPRGLERLGGPAQIARDERDLGFGDDAPRAGHRLPRAEGAPRAPQQRLGANEIAELRHRDAAQRQRRRVVAQATRFSARGGPRCERPRRGVISESIEIPPNLSLPPLLDHSQHQSRRTSTTKRPGATGYARYSTAKNKKMQNVLSKR